MKYDTTLTKEIGHQIDQSTSSLVGSRKKKTSHVLSFQWLYDALKIRMLLRLTWEA